MNILGLSKSDSTEVDAAREAKKASLVSEIKTQVKMLMEESVVRSYVHEENVVITGLCASVEAILRMGLRLNMSNFFDDNLTLSLCRRISKFCPAAQKTLDRMNFYKQSVISRYKRATERTRPTSVHGNSNEHSSLPVYHRTSTLLSNFGLADTDASTADDIHGRITRAMSLKYPADPPEVEQKLKNFWIRVALLEKVLDKIVQYLAENSSCYYESWSVMADPCNGMLVADLLRGPCAIDYSRTRTSDHLFSDPPVDELILRHKISVDFERVASDNDSESMSANQNDSSTNSLLESQPPEDQSDDLHSSVGGASLSTESWIGSASEGDGSVSHSLSESTRKHLAMAAKKHVDSMHQGGQSKLLFGKNNVHIQTADCARLMPGYLSIHDYGADTGLVIKWTPNWAMASELVPGTAHHRRSVYDNADGSDDSSLSDEQEALGFSVDRRRGSYWQYAVEIKVMDLVYIHCHVYETEWIPEEGGQTLTWQRDATRHLTSIAGDYSIVLIRKDGVQLPSLLFFSKSQSLRFLDRLEHGLHKRGGHLDPPLFVNESKKKIVKINPLQPRDRNSVSFAIGSWFLNFLDGFNHEPSAQTPKAFQLKPSDRPKSATSAREIMRTSSAGNLVNRTDLAETDSTKLATMLSDSTGFPYRTLRVVYAGADKGKQNDTWYLIGKLERARSIRSGSLSIGDKVSSVVNSQGESELERECRHIRFTVVADVFRKWLSYCRKMRVLQSSLSRAVAQKVVISDEPTSAKDGVTEELWQRQLQNPDPHFTFPELCRYVYFGSCSPSIRHRVWPYLLGVYPWGCDSEKLDSIDEFNRKVYETALSEWQCAQKWAKDYDKNDEPYTPPLSAKNGRRYNLPRPTSCLLPSSKIDYGSDEDSSLSRTPTESILTHSATVDRISHDSVDQGGKTSSRMSRLFFFHNGNDAASDSVQPQSGSRSEVKCDVPHTNTELPRSIELKELVLPLPKTDSTALSGRTVTLNDKSSPKVENTVQLRNGKCVFYADFHEEHNAPNESTASTPRTPSTPVEPGDQPTSPQPLNHSNNRRIPSSPVDDQALFAGPPSPTSEVGGNKNETPDTCPFPSDIMKALTVNLYRIDKDVSRCDRNHAYFAEPKSIGQIDAQLSYIGVYEQPVLSENLIKLRNIICTWVWLHLDSGYVQGMCDLLAPLLVILDEESLTYACFNALMEWMLPNFPLPKSRTSITFYKLTSRPTLLSMAKRCTQPIGEFSMNKPVSRENRQPSVHSSSPLPSIPTVPCPYGPKRAQKCFMDEKFTHLNALIEVFDPELHTFLVDKTLDSQLYFCYRWLLLDFKRELSYDDVFAVWEVIWSARRIVAYDFAVFFAAAMLIYYRDIILYYDMDLSEIIRFFNELSEKHNVKAILDVARDLILQMQTFLDGA